MSINPGKPKCCRRLVTISLGPNGEVEISKQGDRSTNNMPVQMSPQDQAKAFDDIKNNPDEWIPVGDPTGNGWIDSKRPAIFCGDDLKEWKSNRLSGDEGAEGTA